MKDLTKELSYILKQAVEFKDKYFDDEPVTLDHISMYCHTDEDYEETIEQMLAIANLTHEVHNGVYFSLKKEIHVVDDVWVVKHVKITKPSNAKPQRGSATFVAKDFDNFSTKFSDIANINLIKEEAYQKLALFDPDSDVVLYVASKLFVNVEQKKDEVKVTAQEEFRKLLDEEKQRRMQLMADFQNFQKRLESEKSTWGALTNMALIKEMLEVYDDIALAFQDENLTLDHAKSSLRSAQDKLIAGVVLSGVEVIPVNIGDDFNKETMEAISTVSVSDDQKGKVIAVISSAYKYKDKEGILKPAKVVVGK